MLRFMILLLGLLVPVASMPESERAKAAKTVSGFLVLSVEAEHEPNPYLRDRPLMHVIAERY